MSKSKTAKTPATKPQNVVSPTLGAAIDIDLIQKQQGKNHKRIGVLLAEATKLQNDNSSLEARRQERLREFDRTTR